MADVGEKKKITNDQDTAADGRLKHAFPTLSDEQIEDLEPYGERVHFKKGDLVWNAGDVDLCMYVVVSGEMDILDGSTDKYVATHTKGGFSGDIDVLLRRKVVVKAVAATDLEVLAIPPDCVRTIVGECPELSETILQAFLIRRTILIESGRFGVQVYGSRYSPDTLRIREFLARHEYPVVWEDLESREDAAFLLKEFQVTEDETPIVILPSGNILRVPSNVELAESLGVKRTLEARDYDLVIVGAGPAGLAAAVYGASEGLSTLLVDAIGPGGQAGTSSRIENYMGFPLGISGQQLADGAMMQAQKFGARTITPTAVRNITCNPLSGHTVEFEGMEPVDCRCVILASGARYRKLEVQGMERYEGRGIYYAATNVERVLCSESEVAVCGAGNSAGQAAVFMAENTKHVYMLVRGDDLRKSMSSYLARRIEQSPNITLLLNTEVCDVSGGDFLEGATFLNSKTGEKRTEEVKGIFVMIGAIPNTDWVPESIAMDSKGFVLTGQQVTEQGKWEEDRSPYFLETSCPGVFAVGDVRSNSIKRVASAVGEGSMAVALAHQFLAL